MIQTGMQIIIMPRRAKYRPKSKILTLCTKIDRKNGVVDFEYFDLSKIGERRRFEKVARCVRLRKFISKIRLNHPGFKYFAEPTGHFQGLDRI